MGRRRRSTLMAVRPTSRGLPPPVGKWNALLPLGVLIEPWQQSASDIPLRDELSPLKCSGCGAYQSSLDSVSTSLPSPRLRCAFCGEKGRSPAASVSGSAAAALGHRDVFEYRELNGNVNGAHGASHGLLCIVVVDTTMAKRRLERVAEAVDDARRAMPPDTLISLITYVCIHFYFLACAPLSYRTYPSKVKFSFWSRVPTVQQLYNSPFVPVSFCRCLCVCFACMYLRGRWT